MEGGNEQIKREYGEEEQEVASMEVVNNKKNPENLFMYKVNTESMENREYLEKKENYVKIYRINRTRRTCSITCRARQIKRYKWNLKRRN